MSCIFVFVSIKMCQIPLVVLYHATALLKWENGNIYKKQTFKGWESSSSESLNSMQIAIFLACRIFKGKRGGGDKKPGHINIYKRTWEAKTQENLIPKMKPHSLHSPWQKTFDCHISSTWDKHKGGYYRWCTAECILVGRAQIPLPQTWLEF